MKVCIITVYNGLNTGSFLQAYTIKHYFEMMGCEVSFLERKGGTGSKRTCLSLIVKQLFGLKIESAHIFLNKYLSLWKALKQYNITSKNIKDLKEIDLFILGSDEIWNIRKDSWRNNPVYWGQGLPEKCCISSYAPSINDASLEELKKVEYIPECLSRMDYISVRDLNSRSLLSCFTDKQIHLTCDPTLLFDSQYYSSIESKRIYRDYIFIYSLGGANSPSNDSQIIKDYAKRNNLLIVGTHSFPCDVFVEPFAWDFLSLIHHASCVITNTFHGTVFSIIYRKKFVSYNRSAKVSEILNELSLEDRLVQCGGEIEGKLQSVDYSNAEKRLEGMIRQSESYIDKVLMNSRTTHD